MSIHGALQRAHAAKQLDYTPVADSDPVERVLLYGRELRDFFAGPFVGAGATAHEKRAGELLADFQSFVKGDHVALCFRPREHKDSRFGRLEPIESAVWDFRSQKHNPSLRVFGGFAAPDIFVALSWWPRWYKVPWSDKEPLGKDDDRWAAAIADADQKWRDILLGKKRVTGEEVGRYVTRNASVS